MKESNFGFKKYNKEEHTSKVKEVFNKVANKYDLMNDVMSLGMQRLWKKKFIDSLNLNKNENLTFIDLAGGTGDIAKRILSKYKKEIKVKVVDINQEMLEYGKKRAIDNNLFKYLNFNCANGEKVPYKNNEFDFYTIAFGIRNFTNIDKGLEEAYRVLKKGGKFICLEFSKVNNEILSKIYDLYSFNIVPKIGKLVADDEDSYQYLVES